MSSPNDPRFAATPPSPRGDHQPFGAPVSPEAHPQAPDFVPAAPPIPPVAHGDQLLQIYGYIPAAAAPTPEPKKASGKTGAIIVAALVVLALVAAGIYFIRGPQASDQRPANVAPGPGTTASLRQYFEDLKYRCTDENVTGIVSYVCVSVGDVDVTAYVSGPQSGYLGRVALYVSNGDDRSYLSTQKYLLDQFLGDPAKVQSALDKFASGSFTKYANATFDQVEADGAPNGAVVLATSGWLPPTLQKPKLKFKQSELKAALPDYSCESKDDSMECTKTTDALNYTITTGTQLGAPTALAVWIHGPGSEAALHAEMSRVFGTLNPELVKVAAGLNGTDGTRATISNGLVFDYYGPARPGSSSDASGLYVHTSCWAGQQSWC